MGVKCSSDMQKKKAVPMCHCSSSDDELRLSSEFQQHPESNMMKAPPFDKAHRAYANTLRTEEVAAVIFLQTTAFLQP